MSALIKPLIHTVGSDVPVSATVNAEHVHAISKTDLPAATPNGKPVYLITFDILSTDNQIKTVTWTYSTVAGALAARNAAYAAAVALISTAV